MTTSTIGEYLAEHGAALGVLEDIADRAERERFVLAHARDIFNRRGYLVRTVILRTKAPHRLMLFTLDLPPDQADNAPVLIRAAAQAVGAQQLYVVMEAWFSVIVDDAERAEIERTGVARVMPRNDPQRQEAVLVTSEDVFRVPPTRTQKAEITRDAKGKPTLGPWEDFPASSGRMTCLLPPEAFIAVGQKMPSV